MLTIWLTSGYLALYALVYALIVIEAIALCTRIQTGKYLTMSKYSYDVVVVGAGNAALCAALAAEENGARTLVLERAPESENGGNSRFTAGAIRFAYPDWKIFAKS